MLANALEKIATQIDHKTVLTKATEVLISHPDIVAVLLGGSIANGSPDFFSDIDLYLFIEDDSFAKVFSQRHDLAKKIGKVIFSFLADHHPGGEHDHVVLYDNLIHVDFMYQRTSQVSPAAKWTSMLLLKDKDDCYQDLIAESALSALSTPAPENITIINQKFWTWCWYTFGKIVRGELWEALADIHLIRSWAILPMIDFMQNAPDEGYRRLESKLDNELSEQLKATIPLYTTKSVYYALQEEIKLFVKLRDKVFGQYNLPVDAQAENIVISGIADQWQIFQKKP